jgi:hypothetical protein
VAHRRCPAYAEVEEQMVFQSQPRIAFSAPQGQFAESALTFSSNDGLDSLEQLAQADAADRSLLLLVVCAAAATLALALASGLAF